MENEILKRIQDYALEEIMGDRFGKYAKEIILDRAIPDVRDGLKPVQRRILYAMYKAGNTSDKGYIKCAATVGDVLGKFHPHGDSSVYDAMVRMSQWWKQNHILVDRDENGHYALSASQLSHIPTAFICSRDSSAYQLLKILKEKNIRVPEDVSITGFDDYILSSLCTPKITTYSIDVAKLTDSCIWLLLDRIAQPDRPLRHIVISGKIMERDSVRTLSTNLEPR